MPNHLFAFLLVLSIVCLIGWTRMFIDWYKTQRDHTPRFYYSDDMPPLSRMQYIEIAGVDPIAMMKRNHP